MSMSTTTIPPSTPLTWKQADVDVHVATRNGEFAGFVEFDGSAHRLRDERGTDLGSFPPSTTPSVRSPRRTSRSAPRRRRLARAPAVGACGGREPDSYAGSRMRARLVWPQRSASALGYLSSRAPDRQESIISLSPSPSVTATLGPVRQTYAGSADFPPLARAYRDVQQVVKETGLLQRTPVFYSLVGAALVVAFAGCVAGFLLLGDSWFQLLIAAALGIVFTQVAFLAHEAAHRQILSTGPANFRLARVLAGIIGMSYHWWDSKHTRHHGNPNQVGKDPDIQVDTISFLEEDAAQSRGIVRLITRKQGWLFFPF